MKKRLLATFLALCLVIGLLPAGVMAADMTVEGDRSEKLDFDGGTHTVTLRNLTIDDPSGVGSSAIDIHNGAQVTLILEGYNTLRGDLNKPVIWVEAGSSLTIEGPGTLDVSGNGTLSNGAAAIGGAYDDDEFGDITINGGTVIATGVGGGGRYWRRI